MRPNEAEKKKKRIKRLTRPPVSPGEKWCTRCEQPRAVEDFSFDARRKDGRRDWCRSCCAAAAKGTRKKIERGLEPGQMWCPACERPLPVEDFAVDVHRKGGRRTPCRSCLAARLAAARAAKAPSADRAALPAGQKWCPGCTQPRPIEDFAADAHRKDGRRVYCRACRAARRGTAEDRTRPLRDERQRAVRRDRRIEAGVIREIATAMILASGEKVCRVCETPKPLEDFMPRRGAPDGHVGTCRACVAASRRAPDPEDVETAARWASRDAEMDRRADELRVKREEKAARSTGATPDTTTKNPS